MATTLTILKTAYVNLRNTLKYNYCNTMKSSKPFLAKKTLVFYSLMVPLFLMAQTKVEGVVNDSEGKPIPGVNVFIKGTIDGAASAPDGTFGFTTTAKNRQVLVASMVGFESYEVQIDLNQKLVKLEIVLHEAINSLNAVVITAGTFEASDEHKAVVLKPLDIVTTASSAGDLYGALRSLPGTQQVGEDGRLFVRGGEASETRSYMDGMLIANPYSSQVPDIPARGRFSPFMFTGTVFSTGGYSAEYGQAMSSALVLKTNGLAERTESGLSLTSVGAGLSHTHRSDNKSVSASLDYSNLWPYFKLINQKMDYSQAPEELSGSLSYRYKSKSGQLLRVFGNFSHGNVSIQYPNFDADATTTPIGLKNRNYYLNSTYNGSFSEQTSWYAGISMALDHDKRQLGLDKLNERNNHIQARFTINHSISKATKIKVGAETYSQFFEQNYKNAASSWYETDFQEYQASAFAEAEIAPTAMIALRAGIRSEYSVLLGRANLAPRLAASLRTSRHSQVSLALGRFFQNPTQDVLLFTPELGFETADHAILNFQYLHNDRVFRAEAYYKDYANLVRYTSLHNPDPTTYSNTGNGYAKGFDLFWRDQKTLRELDYWVSYSWIDSKRLFRDYPEKATPTFISEHNLNIVAKYFVDKISTQFGATYAMASGRPYDNPNQAGFLVSKTKSYHDLSINASYLTELFGQFTIVHLIVSNVLGSSQIFGYHFSPEPGANGLYQSYAITPAASRFLFVGIFISIDHRKKETPRNTQ